MILATLLLSLTVAQAEPAADCCGAKKGGVAPQVRKLTKEITSGALCITHDPAKDVKAEVAALSEQEVMARLVYSEALATNCQGVPTNGIMNGIATVIANRVKKGGVYGKGIRGVVFQPSQFNSSLSTKYSRSRLKEFLCPMAGRDWEQAKNSTARALDPKAPNFLGSDAVVMTYYYKHFLPKVVVPPSWADPKSPKRVKLPGLPDECIGFFRN